MEFHLQGMDAVMKYYNDEGFLRAVSQKMGGVPREVRVAMQNIHEAIRYFYPFLFFFWQLIFFQGW